MIATRGLKAVITAGGIGTRLLPFSKEIPKEMSPLIVKNSHNSSEVKPIIQAVYEQLYKQGIRDFFIIVGRGKRAIQDHFTPDTGFIELLRNKGKKSDGLVEFYGELGSSNLVFVVQPKPLGFGDAVLRARPYIKERFLVHAGDTYVISKGDDCLKRLRRVHAKYDASATILLQEVDDPRQYGVVVGKEVADGVVRINGALEKPEKPPSNIAIMPVYIFESEIFGALSKTKPDRGGEVQLTNAIQSLISSGKDVVGVKLRNDELRLDIGTPETMMQALKLSSKYVGVEG